MAKQFFWSAVFLAGGILMPWVIDSCSRIAGCGAGTLPF